MEKTIKELEDLIISYRGDLHATIAIKECIKIIKKNKGE
jgi:hypothetical protein